ncbi:glutathionylspermidine synthase family protein [Phaeodactylibacter luteus]|nr:glutathionylspermidine synthase family protein [Phaeodactylibacter luteus]
MVDSRLESLKELPHSALAKRGLEWFAQGDNHDYLAQEAIGVSAREVSAYSQAAAALYNLLLRTAQAVHAQALWKNAGVPENAVEAVAWSMRREWGNHLIGRFDFAGGLEGLPLRLIEFNADTLSLMPETETIQSLCTGQLRGSRPTWAALREAMARKWAQILRQHPGREPALLLIGLGHEEDWLNLDVVEMAARQAGFTEVHRAPLEEVIFSPDEGVFLEIEQDAYLRYDFVFKMVPWDFIAHEEPELMDILTQIITRELCVVFNPAYSLLLQSKALLTLPAELGLQHPALLRCSWDKGAFTGQRFAAKPIFGRTGDNVSLFDGSPQPIAQNAGDFPSGPFVYQELAPFNTDSDGARYQPSVFMSGEEACGLGIRRQEGLIVDDDAEFISHFITD